MFTNAIKNLPTPVASWREWADVNDRMQSKINVDNTYLIDMTFKGKRGFIPYAKPRYILIIGLGSDWLCYEHSLSNHWQFNFRGKTKFL